MRIWVDFCSGPSWKASWQAASNPASPDCMGSWLPICASSCGYGRNPSARKRRSRKLSARRSPGIYRSIDFSPATSGDGCLQFYITCYITGYVKPDIVEELGYLALGTRLKRLGERLQAQTQVLLEESGLNLPASHFPILAALVRLGALREGEIAEAVGTSQPGETRKLDRLQSDGCVKATAASCDRRVRTFGLTAAGDKLVSSARRKFWPRIEAAVAAACSGRAESLLPALAALEESLQEAPLHTRAGGKTHARA